MVVTLGMESLSEHEMITHFASWKEAGRAYKDEHYDSAKKGDKKHAELSFEKRRVTLTVAIKTVYRTLNEKPEFASVDEHRTVLFDLNQEGEGHVLGLCGGPDREGVPAPVPRLQGVARGRQGARPSC